MMCCAVYRDVEHIEPITKADMLEFYRTYFLPSSPSRAKTSVHMVAKASAEDIAAKMDPAEQKASLVATLSDVLNQLGMTVDAKQLAARMEKVDVRGGDTEGILNAVGSYLQESADVAKEQVEQVMRQGQAVLAQVLPKLGIKAKGTEVPVREKADDGEEATNGTTANGEVKGKKKSIIIEDAKAWKASMPLSAGPTPVKPLSEFEELEPKL